jgi:hypothetical protein
MTALAGLPIYLDLASVMGMHKSIEKPIDPDSFIEQAQKFLPQG